MTRLAPGAVIAGGKYLLSHELARGGMGSVFVGRHLQLDVPIAIKFIDPAKTAAGDARARFEREARAAAQLRNPNIVQIFDHGVDGDLPYIVMELLQGEDLGARLRRERRLSLRQVASILLQLARGLRRAHELGIVHRDLKPGNIFMAQVEDEEIVKILDFGLAKAFVSDVADEVTQSGVVMGSPQYMSPEQARGVKNIDPRSDIWSVGVVAYRCITGVLPFRGDQVGDLVVKICVEPAAPPSSIVPDVTPEIDAFFERALAKDPEKRYRNVVEMASDFAAIVGRLYPGELMPSLGRLMTTSPGSMPQIRPPADADVPIAAPPLPPPPQAAPAPPPGAASRVATPPPGAPPPPVLFGPPPGPAPFVPASVPSPAPAEMQTSTLPGTTIARVHPLAPRPMTPARLAAIAVGPAVVVIAVLFIAFNSPKGTSEARSTDTPILAERGLSKAIPAVKVSAASAATSPKPPEPKVEADAEAGVVEDAGVAPVRTGPVKKQRNFGY
ncbi:serine/threonine-protein kinase [Polyangium sp. y55x31]|uniref:serine/threonine-protein kinase n=1 Tax=Polyangium sp. y55x31 TaxID=3042688 RepID=UPI0024824514|nr:serine/threonine-protein kinase [Polyangium sp. y55x31]MDI1483439.1 serine/threonine-protein kinase [Polyangium sp. y55x31]